MANLVVKNGFNGVRGNGKDEGTAKNRPIGSKQLPPLEGIDTRKHGDATTPRLLRRASDSSSQASEYLILLSEDVKQLKHLALSLGIKRRIRAMADQHGGSSTDPHRRRLLVMPRKLPALHQPVHFGKQSVKWTKRQDSCLTDADLSASYKPLDEKLPSAVKRRLKPVAVPHLGLKYRLPAVTKRHQKPER